MRPNSRDHTRIRPAFLLAAVTGAGSQGQKVPILSTLSGGIWGSDVDKAFEAGAQSTL